MDDWKVTECSHYFACDKGMCDLPPMSAKEIADIIMFLRAHNYPKPSDCPEADCPKHRPACALGICNVAIGLCGDF